MTKLISLFLAACLGGAALSAAAAPLPRTIAAIKPGVVGIGTHLRTRSPAIVFHATGFVVGDGLSVISNAHAVGSLDTERLETLGIVTGKGDKLEFRAATVVAIDRAHDLVHLRLSGAPLPALTLAGSELAEEGRDLAFTGFPLGIQLGMNAVTHRALLAAQTPAVLPTPTSRGLNPRTVATLQRGTPFTLYQLDGTAYPANSGSPVYDPDTGAVLAVINMTLVKGTKESAITDPSGISYAVPVRHVHELLQQGGAGK
ncbi:MAG: trypsin-like serine protease [Pseudoduganella sp.]|jgi:S1-C subfamily serine protease|nr:trypsin-like serine protease [Pseudoduganella sp.]